MKSKILFTLVVALALLAGCIKDGEGDYLLTVRTEVNDSTVVTSEGGYMEGISTKDSIIKNSFETILTDNQIQKLNCYTILHSEFRDLNTTRNGIKEVGYVYSRTNKMPVIGDKENCKALAVKKDVSPTEPNVIFDGTIEQLDFNSTYYVRSYAICKGDGKSDSVIYNSRPLVYQTVLPEDVWFERNKAPSAPNEMTARADAFHCTMNDNVYVYGGRNATTMYNDLWTYDATKDTWQQLGTCDIVETQHTGPSRRCNGAMIAYPVPRASDTLLFIIGGEVGNDAYTGTVIYYSTAHNSFDDQTRHPNAGSTFVLHDDYGQPVYEQEYEKNEDGTFKYDANGNKIPVYDSNGKPVYVKDALGNPKELTVHSTRNFIEELPIYNEVNGKKTYYGLAGCVAFTLTDRNFTKFFVAFGKSDLSTNGQKHISTAVYEYNENNDWSKQGSDLLYPAWVNLSANKDKTAEGLYQPVCVQCGDKVIVGSGESSKNSKVSKNFYTLSYSISDQNIRMEALPGVGDDFEARANAAAFYLNYNKGGVVYDRFYVGTGRTCAETDFNEEPEQLLNDFWCYDFVSKQWSRKADCSNIVRQGAVGFSVKRADDYFVQNFGENIRGMFSFGEGYESNNGFRTLNDNWEYIP